MNINRLLGIFIAITVLVWILVFALSPQLKYQKNSNINIPKLPEPSIDLEQLQKIEFNEVKNNSLEIDIKDTLPSAKEKVNKIDFNLYVYKIGAFGSSATISKDVKSYNDAGFPALAVLMVLASVIGAYYYLRVIWYMYFDKATDRSVFQVQSDMRLVLSLNGVSVLVLGIIPGWLLTLCINVIAKVY